MVGLPASGKGECSAVAEELGIPVIVMGDLIRRYAEEAGLPATDQHLGTIARRLREERGMAALAELTVPAVREQKAPVVLIDGIRGDAEVELFRKTFSDFTLIAIDCPFQIRLARLRSRGRSDDMVNEDDLLSRDERECGFGLVHAMDGADIWIDNTASLEECRAGIEKILKTIGSSV
ncbi:AAA family ATPase [Methanocalculus sp.]|uniref:AAA family ATPase n=1 Tax=Methanocalculus sp. TaxID=2004547 RepID=UPI003452CFFD